MDSRMPEGEEVEEVEEVETEEETRRVKARWISKGGRKPIMAVNSERAMMISGL